MTYEARAREIAFTAAQVVEYEAMLARQYFIDSPDAIEIKADLEGARRDLDRLRAEQRRAERS